MRSTQKTISIDSHLWEALDKWIKTEDAKNRGFHSKAQFANMAVSSFLTQYRDNKETHIEMLKTVTESYNVVIDKLDKQRLAVERFEKLWMRTTFPNIDKNH